MQTHLYRRGATYYWRRLVPTALQPILGARDLRASLQTNLPETARSRASRMDAAFDLALEELEQIVRSGQVLPDAVKSRFIRELFREVIEKADANRLMGGTRTADKIEADVAKALNLQRTVESLIVANHLEQGKMHADRFLVRDGIRLDKNSLEYHQLARDLLRGMVDAFGVVADHERGLGPELDFSPLTPAPANEQSDGIRTSEQIRQDKENYAKPFSVHAKAHRDKKMVSKDWGWDQANDADAAFRLFVELIGDKPVAHYSGDDARAFLELLGRLPVGVNQRHPYIGLSALAGIRKADEIEAEQVAAADARIKREKLKGAEADKLRLNAQVQRISTTTVIKHRDHCNAVFKNVQSILNVAVKNPFSGSIAAPSVCC